MMLNERKKMGSILKTLLEGKVVPSEISKLTGTGVLCILPNATKKQIVGINEIIQDVIESCTLIYPVDTWAYTNQDYFIEKGKSLEDSTNNKLRSCYDEIKSGTYTFETIKEIFSVYAEEAKKIWEGEKNSEEFVEDISDFMKRWNYPMQIIATTLWGDIKYMDKCEAENAAAYFSHIQQCL